MVFLAWILYGMRIDLESLCVSCVILMQFTHGPTMPNIETFKNLGDGCGTLQIPFVSALLIGRTIFASMDQHPIQDSGQ